MSMKSQAQRGAMYAAKAGNSTLGIPQSVGAEFVKSDKGGKLPATVKPNKASTRNYAKGGPVQHLARGGSAFVNPDKYPGWPQMAGTSGPYRQGEVISSEEAAQTGNPDERPVHYKPGFYE